MERLNGNIIFQSLPVRLFGALGSPKHNRLLRAYKSALRPDSLQYRTTVQSIRAEHIEACQAYIKSPIIVRHLITDILGDLGATLDILETVHATGKVTSETLDAVICVGEKLACRFLSGILQDQSISSTVIDLSRILKVLPGQAINQDLYDKISESIVTTVRQSDARVRVVTGCFGSLPGGLLASIGRGYTDLCASLLASGIQATELQIWKEVEGFYTADPRRVPSARLTSSITPYEALELTFNGSEIIHFEAMNQARHSKIPIRVKNVMNPSGAGTIIRPENSCGFPQTNNFMEEAFEYRDMFPCKESQYDKCITAMTSKHGIVMLNVLSRERSLRQNFFAKIIAVLDRWKIPIDLICTSQVQMSIAIHLDDPLIPYDAEKPTEAVQNHSLRSAVEQLQELGKVRFLTRMAIISLVGEGMKGCPGTAGRMFSTLGENNINVEMIAQGKFCQYQLLTSQSADLA